MPVIIQTKSDIANNPDFQRVAEGTRRILDLNSARDREEHLYHSLTFCLIDSVFSIGVRYEQVINAVERYRKCYGLKLDRMTSGPLPSKAEQEPMSILLRRINSIGSERFAAEVLRNKGRTSPRNGILKAEAVRRFAVVLVDHQVEYLQDLPRVIGNDELERAVKEIPGQNSGISFRYFLMLAGRDDLIKPDRMVIRFFKGILGRDVKSEECQDLLAGAVQVLKEKFPFISPALLDGLIWRYQRETTEGSHDRAASGCSEPDSAMRSSPLTSLPLLVGETTTPSFRQVYDLLSRKGSGLVISSRGMSYRLQAKNDAILAFPQSGRVAVHEDCWGEKMTCQGTRAGGLYNGEYSIYDWYRDNLLNGGRSN